MIIGLGSDLCDIRRIDDLLSRHGERFKAKCFTTAERATCDARAASSDCYAKRFAAKEAVAKALAGEATGALPWHSVEIVNDPSGRPTVRLSGKALERVPAGSTVHLTLSDEPPYALAFCIIEDRA